MAIAVDSGLFDAAGAEDLLGGIFDRALQGELPEGHRVLTGVTGGDAAPAGWTYFAPDDHAPGVWNIWWIGVDRNSAGRGLAAALLTAAEGFARAAAGRLAIVETSTTSKTARARAFYVKHGYAACGEVPDFYAEGDGKSIFAKKLA
ncbi:MAG: GNAT family N-acetyltransferase [Tagaea sp.]